MITLFKPMRAENKELEFTEISLKDFIVGCVAIHTSERDTDDNEFTPNEFKNV